MTPFASLDFFVVLAIFLAVSFLLGIFRIRSRWWGLAGVFVFGYLAYGQSKKQTIMAIAFLFGQLFLAKLWLRIRKNRDSTLLHWIAVICSIVPLLLVKFSGLYTTMEIGFLGVSYATFRCIQVIVDIGNGTIKEMGILDFIYFSFFPMTLGSGPIDRFHRFIKDVRVIPPSIDDYLKLARMGLFKVLLGLLYKFCFSLLIKEYWLDVVSGDGFLSTISYMYAYSLYLFFDFAGYSLMAVGAGYFLSIKTPDNFKFPFFSIDIKDFWNRWHISLSSWFRDYLYSPFVMALIKRKVSPYIASYSSYAVTMLTMGFWHGLSPRYWIYGAYHAILIILTDLFQRKSKVYRKSRNTTRYELIGILITFNIICFGMLIFSGRLIH